MIKTVHEDFRSNESRMFCLLVHLGNPVTIEYSNNVCSLQVQTKDHRQCTCAQNYHEDLCDLC
ncbi:hypothetical protein Bca4012_035535 [Brassica carinata]